MEVGVWLGAREVVQVGLSSGIETWGDGRVLRKDSLEVASIGGSVSGIWNLSEADRGSNSEWRLCRVYLANPHSK